MTCANCGCVLPKGSLICPACGFQMPAAGPPPPAPPVEPVPPQKSGANWPLIIVLSGVGCLGALFVLGLVAAIVIPNLLNGIDRGKQRRTMIEIRSISSAIEAYAVDYGAKPEAENLEQLKAVLVPKFIANLPQLDGWGKPLNVYSSRDHYQIISTGKDGQPDNCPGGATKQSDADICFSDGEFVQWPEGVQRQ